MDQTVEFVLMEEVEKVQEKKEEEKPEMNFLTVQSQNVENIQQKRANHSSTDQKKTQVNIQKNIQEDNGRQTYVESFISESCFDIGQKVVLKQQITEKFNKFNKEIDELKSKNNILEKQNQELTSKHQELICKNKELTNINLRLLSQIKGLKEENGKKTDKIQQPQINQMKPKKSGCKCCLPLVLLLMVLILTLFATINRFMIYNL